jgi:hypothetical protein
MPRKSVLERCIPLPGCIYTHINTAAGIYVVEEDLYIQANTVDLNYSTLYLNPGGFDLHLSGTTIQEAYIASNTDNLINMQNSARLSDVGLQSITNAGFLNLLSSINLSGDLVNNGTVQNVANSIIFSVSGSITNNGTIRNYESYNLTVNVGGRPSTTEPGAVTLPDERNRGPADHFHPIIPMRNILLRFVIDGIPIRTGPQFYGNATGSEQRHPQVNDGRTGPYDISFDNCQVNEIMFASDLGSTLTAINGGGIINCTFQSITFEGTISLVTATSSSGSIVNQGILQNSGNSITLSWAEASQTMEHQKLRRVPLTINIAGDAFNNGKLEQLYPAAQRQLIPIDPILCGHAFGGTYFYDSNASSAITVNGDNYFTGCNIDLTIRLWS